MKKIAIVIGATGLIGKSLVDQLANSDHISKIITLTRRADTHLSAKVFNQVVDFEQLEHYADSFKGDLLFSCLGTTSKQAGSISTQRKVDVDYQFKAAQLAVNNGVKHYLLVSSSGANVKSHSQYLKMKGELEQKIKTLPFKHTSIFQPSLLVGQRENFRLGEKVASWIMKILCIIPGLQRFRPILAQQVATKMLLVSLQIQKTGQPIDHYRLDKIFSR